MNNESSGGVLNARQAGASVGRIKAVSFDQWGDFRSLRRRIDESCRARLEVAARLAPHFSHEAFDREAGLQLVERSIYATHFKDLSFSDPLRRVSFNLAVIDATVEEVIGSEMDAMLAPFVVSRLTELGAYSLLDPDDTSARPRQYLGASKGAGYFFTPPSVAFEMARSAIGGRKSIASCLDPAAGAGRFSLRSQSRLMQAGWMSAQSARSRTTQSQPSAWREFSSPFVRRWAHLGHSTSNALMQWGYCSMSGGPLTASSWIRRTAG